MIIGIGSVVLVIHGPFQDGPAGGIDLKFIFGIAVVDLSFIDDVAVVLISFDLDMAPVSYTHLTLPTILLV